MTANSPISFISKHASVNPIMANKLGEKSETLKNL